MFSHSVIDVDANFSDLQSSRRALLRSLSEDAVSIASSLEDLSGWFEYIEKELAGPPIDPLSQWMEYLGYENPYTLLDMYEVLRTVIDILRRHDDPTIISIDDIAKAMCDARTLPLDSRKMNTGRQSVLYLLGCLTMRFRVAPSTSDNLLAISAPCSRSFSLRPQPVVPGAQRSIGKLLGSYGSLYMDFDPQDEPLHASMLKYSTLETIAKIKIEFVDHIGSHLVFNTLTRRLSIFAHPAFCELHCNKLKNVTIIEKITSGYYDKDSAEITQKLLQEILLSYRLLFAADSKSRKLFFNVYMGNHRLQNTFIKKLISPPKSKNISKIPSDCWPESVVNSEGQLIEQDAYSSSIDFVIFGRRLIELEHHCARQNPSRLRDMWFDRRNRREWITFWAVLVFGGASIILSFLQVILSTIQVVESRATL